jgi:D-alanyl-lipoteichoic acid acyltransferase DltB (MBOAT superfamily)
MLLGGLWHGASWSFVAWGGFHGLALAVDKATGPRPPSRLRAALGWIVTFHLVVALWVPFRIPDARVALDVLVRLTGGWSVAALQSIVAARGWLLVALAVGALFAFAPPDWRSRLERRFATAPLPLRALAFVAVVQAVVQVQGSEVQPFIYFQF